MTEQILSVLPGELADADTAAFKILYSTTELEEIAGKCRKLDGAVKKLTGFDYLILIHKEPFIRSTEVQKFRVICHELYHVERSVPKRPKHKRKSQFARSPSWKVRKHHGDFCEIAEHDRFSFALAELARKRLHLA